MVSVFEIKELRRIRQELNDMAEAEATKLYRLAWRAERHGCKPETVNAIRNEARELHMTGYPERLLDPFKHWQFAFR